MRIATLLVSTTLMSGMVFAAELDECFNKKDVNACTECVRDVCSLAINSLREDLGYYDAKKNYDFAVKTAVQDEIEKAKRELDSIKEKVSIAMRDRTSELYQKHFKKCLAKNGSSIESQCQKLKNN